MDGATYRVEPAPAGEHGWLVLNGTRVLMVCSDKDEADRIALALSLRTQAPNASRPPERSGPDSSPSRATG